MDAPAGGYPPYNACPSEGAWDMGPSYEGMGPR
jgi:hypothetical protein